MKSKNIIPIIAAMALMSCAQPSTKEATPAAAYDINLDSTYQAFPQVEVVDYIPLETSDSSLIAGLTKVIAHDDMIYVWDRIQKKVLLFGKDGRYAGGIHRVGQGPGEYTEPFDMDVDAAGNVYVYDWNTQSLIKYADGDVSRPEVMKIGEYCMDVAVTDGYVYLGNIVREGVPAISLAAWDRRTHELKVLEENTLPEAAALPYEGQYIFRSDSLLAFSERFHPDLLRLTEGEGQAFVSFRSRKLPTDDKVRTLAAADPMAQMQARMQYIMGVSACYETPEYIWLAFSSVPKIHCLVRKADGSIAWTDKAVQGLPSANVCAVLGHHFVASFTPSDKNKEAAMTATTNPDLQKKLEGLTEESNPVLVVFDVK